MNKYNHPQIILAILVFLSIPNLNAYGAQKCDSNLLETTPINRFEINTKNSIVYDGLTRLTWKICAEGRLFANGHCSGNLKFTWNDISRIIKNEGSGWRLPSIDELKSIEEKSCINPSINLKVFPDTRPSSFWSSTVDSNDSDYAYNFYFGRALVKNDLKTSTFYVRLVIDERWYPPSDAQGN